MAVQASLVYTAADGTKQDLILRIGEDTTIGRHPNCSLTISQPSVSRRHARLWFDQGVWFVEDLQSSNGTFVNNRRINRAQLTEGDELRCGDFVLTYGIEERTRAVKTADRREKAPMPAQSPQVSNRATVGLESPPPIPEAPRLSAPRPAAPVAPTPAPAPAPAPAPTPRADNGFDNHRDSGLQRELSEARDNASRLETELQDLRDQLQSQNNALSEARDSASAAQTELNATRTELNAARTERDAAKRDVERLEDQKEQQNAEITELSTKNRDLNQEIAQLKNDLSAAKTTDVIEDHASELAETKDEVNSLREQLESKNRDLATLRKDLEDMHLRSPTQVASSDNENPPAVSSEFSASFASHSSELRVALKAASGFVQEVKDVFKAVAEMKPGSNADQSVLNLEETFDDNGGLDPVNSLETAFDNMEQTARELRKLSKNL